MTRYFSEYPGMFDHEKIGLMSKALDNAWAAVQAIYVRDDEAEMARAKLAKSIIAAAQGGELDPRLLSEGALVKLAGCKIEGNGSLDGTGA